MLMNKASGLPLAEFMVQVQARVQAQLQLRFEPAVLSVAPRLAEAMRYSVLSGGKRLRPALVYASYLAFADDWQVVDPVAMAVELMHAYSLVHDDLPAMDNDVLRRGLPTCHVAFDPATAILVGDAMQSLAFEVMAESALPAVQVVKMVSMLAQASGAQGMVGGQALDLAATGQLQSLEILKPSSPTPQPLATPEPFLVNAEQLESIHRHKTGCLIALSVGLGALAAGVDVGNLGTLQALEEFGHAIGLGFQIQDDILDITSTTEVLGKTVGADQSLAKLTYPAFIGLEGAKQLAQQCLQRAQQALLRVPQADTRLLQALATALIERSY